MTDFAAAQQAREAAWLSPAGTPSYPARRERPEPDAPWRTPFQRDRDRIVHSKAFRRLKHKTQVFVAPEGDHYRTRLTHTLEVTGISRTVARALRLNEDLTEAIGLGHDVGHPPFGHIGEDVLDRAGRERFGRVVPPQRALAAGGRRPRGPQPHRAGARRHPAPLQRRRRARHARGQDRPPGGPDRLHQPRHRRRGAGRACSRPRTSRRRRSRSSARPAPRASTRSCTDLVEHSEAANDIVAGRGRRPGDVLACARSCSSACTSAPRARAEHAKIERVLQGLFDYYCDAPRRAARGRQARGRPRDRLPRRDDRPVRDPGLDGALRPAGPGALMARYTDESRERVRDAVDFEELVGARTELKRAGRRAPAGPVSVPRGTHAVVRHQPDREGLPLLRLRRRG